MRQTTLALCVTLSLSSTSFAAWNIDCEGPKDNYMFLSTSSFSGAPNLSYQSGDKAINFRGHREIMILDEGMVQGFRRQLDNTLNYEYIGFTLPEHLTDSCFKMTVLAEYGRGRALVWSENIVMRCTATHVLY